MPPSIKAVVGLCSAGALAVGAGVAGQQAAPGENPRTAPDHLLVRRATALPRQGGASPVLRVPLNSALPPAWWSMAATALPPVSAHSAVPSAEAVSGTRQSVSGRTNAAGGEVYSSMVRRIARRYSVEWKLVMAIIASESGGDPNAVSPAGAVGLMQLMPDTATDLGVVDPLDPEQNVEGAVRYLSSLLSTFGSVDLTLIAYNAGPGFAKRYQDGGVELGAETRTFLMRVGAFLN
jgi:soluble lytic murein transglycosylase-like protein